MPVGVKNEQWKRIVIIEGIYATQDALDEIEGLRIFLQSSEEYRYKRRLERDLKEREYTEDFINKVFFEMALPYEKIFLNPTIEKADILIENLDGDLDLDKVSEYVVQLLRWTPKNKTLVNIINNCLLEP